MDVHCLVKKIKNVVIMFLLPVLVCFVCLMLVACSPDITLSEAIKIAEKEFGCERILWIETDSAPLFSPEEYRHRSHYSFYVVGEKAGQEIYIVIPSMPDLDNPYLATWNLDYTFSQVVDKFNEYGANYFVGVPQRDDSRRFIKFEDDPEYFKEYTDYYDIGCDGDTFYDRLDVKGVFTYQWMEGRDVRYCIVTQENGELKAYTR